MTTFNDFIKAVFSRKTQSVWVAVLGKRQSGKTDFCLYLMEKLHQLGLMDGFGSNVPVDTSALSKPFVVDFIEDFETLEQRCRMLNPNPQKRGIKRYFYFGSEMGKWLPRDQAWKNVDFIEKLQTVRKYGLNWVGDAISRVDSRALNEIHFQGCFTKPSVTNPTVAYYVNWVNGKQTDLYNIPKTKIKFDTWYSANFYMTPQNPDMANVPLNKEHEIIKKYLETESWKRAGIDTQTGKRAVLAVLRHHMAHCLSTITKDSPE